MTMPDGIGLKLLSPELSCPSCGFQFGYTDKGKHISFDQWRQQWINRGMQWRGGGIAEPANWTPKKQLLNIGVKV